MAGGKKIVLTGGTNGIGLLAANTLASRGHHLVLLARDEPKAQAVRVEILQTAPAAAIDIVYADFSRLATVAAAAATIKDAVPGIDVLVNNAGMHAFSQRVTEDGFAEMLSVNYLAPWLLTHTLAPVLARSADARVVTVASKAARQAETIDPALDLVDTGAFSRRRSMQLYGKTKLMNIMFSLELARRFEGTNLTSNCLDPGFNATGLGRELPFSTALLRLLTLLGIGDPAQGADIVVRAATSAEFTAKTGMYFSRRGQPIDDLGQAHSPRALEELWQATAAALARFL